MSTFFSSLMEISWSKELERAVYWWNQSECSQQGWSSRSLILNWRACSEGIVEEGPMHSVVDHAEPYGQRPKRLHKSIPDNYVQFPLRDHSRATSYSSPSWSTTTHKQAVHSKRSSSLSFTWGSSKKQQQTQDYNLYLWGMSEERGTRCWVLDRAIALSPRAPTSHRNCKWDRNYRCNCEQIAINTHNDQRVLIAWTNSNNDTKKENEKWKRYIYNKTRIFCSNVGTSPR
jgi:hypothetical protein